jgi:predicted Zn-dependent peptidase
MKVIKKVLPNGLRVIMVLKEESTSVLVSVAVQTGSNYETKADSGISHFLEHMCFKGTTKRPDSTQISRELDEIGASYNASTNRYQTEYYVRVRPKYFSHALDIVSDLYLHPLLPDIEIEKEKGVVCDEIDMYADNPSDVASNLLLSELYGDQVAGRDIAGTKENVRTFTRDQIKKYRDTHYVASKTIITLAGKFDAKEAIQAIEKAFKEMHVGKKVAAQKYTSPKINQNLIVQNKASEQTHIRIAFKSIPLKHKDRRIASLLGELLGGTMSSRLFVRLREQLGVSYYNYATQVSWPQYGYFTLGAGVHKDHTQKAIDAMWEECKKITETFVTPAELSRAQESYVNPTLMSLEMPMAVASYVASFEIYEELYISPEEFEKKMRAITKEDIRRVAKTILKKENMTVVVVGPHDQKTIKAPA